jgi:DNA-binding MarR family transcriptional regulator
MKNIRFRLYFDLYLLAKNIQAHVKQHNADTLAKVVILQLLTDGKTTASAIAKETSIKLSAMMTRLQGLEKEGLIKRIVGKDHREYRSEITPKGKKFLTQVKQTILMRCTKEHTQISDEDIVVTKRVIDALRKGLI